MDLYEKLSQIEKYFEENYPRLGVNKRREGVRLAFEIVKRERLGNLSFLEGEYKNYESFKKRLLKRRYPVSSGKTGLGNFYLPRLDLKKEYAFRPAQGGPQPEKIYFEKSARGSKLFSRLKKLFPGAFFSEIGKLKDFEGEFDLSRYNARNSTLFLVREKFDFLKPCPCTRGCVSCGYFVFNPGFGCPFECSYCFLQGYQNVPGLVLPVNIEDFFAEFDRRFSGLKKKIRIGSGEFTDSLALDPLTGFSSEIAEFFSKKENVYFEFKTKSGNISNLLGIKASPNIVVSFSMTPPALASENEFLSAGFESRLEALSRLEKYGYSAAFHLDPVIFTSGWEKLYKDMLGRIFEAVPPERIKWVSLGTFRFRPETKKAIENRFPDNKILDEEMLLDFDGKLRYPFAVRLEIYSTLVKQLASAGMDVRKLYLCMESREMWDKLGLSAGFAWDL